MNSRQKRFDPANRMANEMVARAKSRSAELLNGEVHMDFVVGYLAGVLADIASRSPASFRALESRVK